MLFATQGASNAREDLKNVRAQVAASGNSPQRNRLVYFIRALQDLEKNGMVAERSKWIATPDPRMYVFTGDPEGSQFSGSQIRIWAAVEVDANGGLLTLLRVADGYHGDRVDYANYLTEATQRLQGARMP